VLGGGWSVAPYFIDCDFGEKPDRNLPQRARNLENIFGWLIIWARSHFVMDKLNRAFEVMDNAMADVLRQKTEVERLRIAERMWRSARVILRGAIQTEHPEWDVDRVNREIARRISHGIVKS
jgi:hypothetical protein